MGTSPQEPPADGRGPDLLDPAIQLLGKALDDVGANRLSMATLARGWVCLQPVSLDDGERIARALGCTTPLDHRLLAPGYTVWSGVRDGMELQVRSVLRDPSGTSW